VGFGALGAIAAVIVILEAIHLGQAAAGWASLMVAVLVLPACSSWWSTDGEYVGRMFLA